MSGWPVIAALGLACLLGGCATHPAYQAPAFDLPAAWANADPDGTLAGTPLLGGHPHWWQRLGDPAINSLVARALADGPLLNEIVARIDQADARIAQDQAALRPRIDIVGSATRAQIGDADTRGAELQIRPVVQNAAAIGPSLSWEIDLWGRLRHQRTAARDRAEAQRADLRAAHLSVAAQVADAVIMLRACTLSLALHDREIASRRAQLAITQQRLAAGSIAPADVANMKTGVANARTAQADIRGTCMRHRDALVALTGESAASVDAALDTRDTLPRPPVSAPALPATVLLNHPAVVAAERELAARWMEIGVAQADRLPRLNLTTALTGQWLSALGANADFTTWSAGPDIVAPIFDGGARGAMVAIMEARYRESFAVVNGALRTAARDVEDALADQQSAIARVRFSHEAETAAGFLLLADEARWRAGSISAYDLEITRRASITAQESVITASRDRARAWIALARSTGGNLADQQGSAAVDESDPT